MRTALEQQFHSGTNTPAWPRVLSVSAGFTYAYDLSRPAGARISRMVLHGRPLADEATVRVALSNYLAGGGDNFTVFAQAPALWSGGQDLDALEAYFRTYGPVAPPSVNRITRSAQAMESNP